MVERDRHDAKRADREVDAGLDLVELELRRHGLERHREELVARDAADHLLELVGGGEQRVDRDLRARRCTPARRTAGPGCGPSARARAARDSAAARRRGSRASLLPSARMPVPASTISVSPDARARLDARRLAAVAHGGRAGHRVTAPDPPEGDLHAARKFYRPRSRLPQSSRRISLWKHTYEPPAANPRDGRRRHRRHRRGDADRGRLGRHRRVDQRRDPRRRRQGRVSRRRRGRGAHGPRLGLARRPRASYDLCVLATQPPNVEDAARTRPAPPRRRRRRSSCCRTGCARSGSPRSSAPTRVIGAIVAWGASMPEPGRYERTAAGGFQLGRLVGASSTPTLAARRRAARGDRPGDD